LGGRTLALGGPVLEGIQQMLSLPPFHNLREYNKLKNDEITSISQPCIDLINVIFHYKVSLENCI